MTGRRRRILYVEINEDGTVGGSHRSMYNIVRLLDRARYEPVVLFYQSNRYVELLRAEGVEVHTWDTVRAGELRMWEPGRPRASKAVLLLGAILHRARFLRRERIDLVHQNNNPRVGYDDWLPACWLARVPCIAHARGVEPAPRGRLGRWLTTRFDRVIAISEFIAGTVRAMGVPPERVRCINNGIEQAALLRRLRRAPQDVRAELAAGPETLVVAVVGHLRRWKGQDVVVAAVKLLDPAVRRRLLVLLIGGTPLDDPEFGQAVIADIERSALGDTIRVMGELPDAADVMNASDVVLLPSTLPEPFGLVVLEGMGLGKVVVASNHGGPAEIVTPGSGLLYEPPAADQLARLLERLVDQPELRASLGRGARERVKAFDVRQTVTQVHEVYRELLGAEH